MIGLILFTKKKREIYSMNWMFVQLSKFRCKMSSSQPDKIERVGGRERGRMIKWKSFHNLHSLSLSFRLWLWCKSSFFAFSPTQTHSMASALSARLVSFFYGSAFSLVFFLIIWAKDRWEIAGSPAWNWITNRVKVTILIHSVIIQAMRRIQNWIMRRENLQFRWKQKRRKSSGLE